MWNCGKKNYHFLSLLSKRNGVLLIRLQFGNNYNNTEQLV